MNGYPDTIPPPWYISTSIPYVNAQPHLGHALEMIQADALARYHRLKGEDVWFLSGTDENSLKNVQAAEREGISTQALVDCNAAAFQALQGPLNLSFDGFIRTSNNPQHTASVHKLWNACVQRGDIYKRAYRGLYCVACEAFYTEEELTNGLCPEHLTRPEVVEEENYFFRLSRYADRLAELIESDQLRILPQTRKNEAQSFIRRGLEDFSISRSRARAHDWGIAVPGDPEQVIYVWFDALTNYISALGYAKDEPSYRRYWAENPQRTHLIGKDILRFHTIYWPAMLLSAQVPLPTSVLIHGFITLNSEKISKTRGNVVDPVPLAERYGADALRYYLLREIPATGDGDFTLERFLQSANTDLADQLGNLLNRTLNMVSRYYGGVVPAPAVYEEVDRRLISRAVDLRERVDAALAQFALHEALAAIWELIGAANKYVQETEPWALAKGRKTDAKAETQLATCLYMLAEALRLIACAIRPFLPATADALVRQLGITLEAVGNWDQALTWGRYPPGTSVQPGRVLFPKFAVATEAVS